MGLVELADVVDLLGCPHCRAPLRETPEGLRCGSDSCPLGAAGAFRVDGRWPILVDHEHSVIEPPGSGPGDGMSAVRERWSIERLPRVLRSLWKPRNRAAVRNIDALVELVGGGRPLVLVIGGGTVGNGVERLYEHPTLRTVSFDIRGTPLVQFIADAHQIPVRDQSVDAVVIQAVLQQALAPERVVTEIHRVLRPDGLVYAETPFLQPVNAGPYDFTRYTSSGHRYLFRAFEEIDAGSVAGAGSQVLSSIDHLLRGLFRSELAGKLARLAFFWLRYLDRLVPTPFTMDDASAYYFLGRRSDIELTPREAVEYYRGAQRAT
jgi:SAM-dependent methyltransferase